jgi:hypothetical protein
MGTGIHQGFGWGVKLNTKQQNAFAKFFCQNIQLLDNDHPFRESPWFETEPENLYLYDALEDFYTDILTPVEIDTDNNKSYLTLFASSSLISEYGTGIKGLTRENVDPMEGFQENLSVHDNEVLIINNIAKFVGTEPNWYLFSQMF